MAFRRGAAHDNQPPDAALAWASPERRLAEDRIWSRLRGGAVNGWKVRRQHPVGRFVVDFACVPLRLVIEIDGGVHERDEVVLNDHHRQQAIEDLGWGPSPASPTSKP